MRVDGKGRLLCLWDWVNNNPELYLFTNNLESQKLLTHLSNGCIVLISEN